MKDQSGKDIWFIRRKI